MKTGKSFRIILRFIIAVLLQCLSAPVSFGKQYEDYLAIQKEQEAREAALNKEFKEIEGHVAALNSAISHCEQDWSDFQEKVCKALESQKQSAQVETQPRPQVQPLEPGQSKIEKAKATTTQKGEKVKPKAVKQVAVKQLVSEVKPASVTKPKITRNTLEVIKPLNPLPVGLTPRVQNSFFLSITIMRYAY